MSLYSNYTDMIRINILFVCGLLNLILIPGCSGDKTSKYKRSTTMQQLTENDWTRLSGQRYFFGHRSVGSNIIEGIVDLKKESNTTGFTIFEINNNSDLKGNVFTHLSIGRNLEPKSKIDGFKNILESGLADSIDIAFMKLCFADINKQTDLEELFNYYKTSINYLQEKYPRLKILHFTVPLVTKQKGLKGLIKRFLKLDNNLYRNKYNELLRNLYDDSELFDLAKIEAKYPDNTSNIYWIKTPGLIPEYSSDGSHLNQQGRLLIARELLNKLLAIN